MKILYAVQGTGNGHLSRARDIIPVLKQYGQVDILVSGTQADVSLDEEIKYQFAGISFIFGKKGGVDILKTVSRLKIFRFIKNLIQLPVHQYDLIINDFEPVTAWACFFKNKFSVGLSHQAAVIHPNAPKPQKKDWLGIFILNFYAPTSVKYGFHFQSFGDNIFTPVIRKDVRRFNPSNQGHFTVYLPAIGDNKIIKILKQIKVEWHVFSKHSKKAYKVDNVNIQPVNNAAFTKSLSSCEGILCGAGFEGPAEALYLGKKVLAVPMVGQYEQQCNAAGLKELGIPVINKLNKKAISVIQEFVQNPQKVDVNYTDQTANIIDHIILSHALKDQAEALAISPS